MKGPKPIPFWDRVQKRKANLRCRLKKNPLMGKAVASINASKTECPKGHPYDGVNIRGNRFCRRCATETARRFRMNNKRREYVVH